MQYLILLPCAEDAQLRWGNGAQEQPPVSGFLFCRSGISKHFTAAKKVRQHPPHANKIAPNLFSGKGKVLINGKPCPMLGRPAKPSYGCKRKVIPYRVRPCVTDDIQVRVFLHGTDEDVFCIPAVAKEENIPLATECRHHLSDHGSGKVKLCGTLFPHAVSQWDSNIRNLVPLSDGDTEHEADKAVAVPVIRVVVGGMVEHF